jgi:hypothetical protein
MKYLKIPIIFLKEIGVHTKWFGIKYKSINRVLKEVSKKWKGLDEDTKRKFVKS